MSQKESTNDWSVEHVRMNEFIGMSMDQVNWTRKSNLTLLSWEEHQRKLFIEYHHFIVKYSHWYSNDLSGHSIYIDWSLVFNGLASQCRSTSQPFVHLRLDSQSKWVSLHRWLITRKVTIHVELTNRSDRSILHHCLTSVQKHSPIER